MIKSVFARSRVVNEKSDVWRELETWAKITAIDLILFIGPTLWVGYGLLLEEPPITVAVAVPVALFGLLFIVLGFGSYIFAPILLPLGFEFVCMDMSFGLYGWVYRPNTGENQ